MADPRTPSEQALPTVEVRNLTKQFVMSEGRTDSFREEVVNAARKMVGMKPASERKTLKALDNINFSLKKGEILGVVGPNGAGKSTLLRILAGITEPTSGEVVIRGKHAAILEIGTGFHPELSGRENIWLNGSLLGYKKSEIDQNLKEIVEFSGVGEFIDMPVKHYSNGMYLRLAFSIAFHSNIDVLFLDEVLAVGDAEFQLRSFKRINELARKGVTIILVSHNPTNISRLCTRCIQLDKGNIEGDGTPLEILSGYIAQAAEKFGRSEGKDKKRGSNDTREIEPDTEVEGEFLLNKLKVDQEGLSDEGKFLTSKPINFEIELEKLSEAGTLEVILQVSEWSDSPLLVDSYRLRRDYTPVIMGKGNYLITCELPAYLFNRGYYSFTFTFTRNGKEHLLRLENALGIEIDLEDDPNNIAWNSQIAAPVRLHLDWQIKGEGLNYHSLK